MLVMVVVKREAPFSWCVFALSPKCISFREFQWQFSYLELMLCPRSFSILPWEARLRLSIL